MPRYNIFTPLESLSNGVAKTVLASVGQATRRHKTYRITFAGSSVTQSDPPVLIELVRFNQTTAGTSTAITPSLVDDQETASITLAARTYTAEPTTATIIETFHVSPIGNNFLWELPVGREFFHKISTTFGMRCTAGSALSNVSASMGFEE